MLGVRLDHLAMPVTKMTSPVLAVAQACAAELPDVLRHPAHRYSVRYDPELPDAEGDKRYQALQAIEAAHPAPQTPDPLTQFVSVPVLAGFAPVRHA